MSNELPGPDPGGEQSGFTGSGTNCTDLALSPATASTADTVSDNGTTTAPYTATCTEASSGTGEKNVSVAYSGDNDTLPCSASAAVQVDAARTKTSVNVSTKEPVVGEPLTHTATVTAPEDTAGPPPSGSSTRTPVMMANLG